MRRSSPHIGRGSAPVLLLQIKYFLLNPGRWRFSYGDLRVGSPLNDRFDGRRALAGVTHYATGLIFLDYRLDILPTLVHECLHALYPEWSERRVRRWEKRIEEIMTAGDAAILHRLLSRRLPR